MVAVTLKYSDGSSTYSQVFSCLSLRGFDEPDEVKLVGVVGDELLDGSLGERIYAFRRVITADVGVLTVRTDRLFVLAWLIAPIRWVGYGGTFIRVAVTSEEFAMEWEQGIDFAKHVTLTVQERDVQTSFPGSPVFPPDLNGSPMLIKLKVRIDGTEASAETFTTNSGKLTTMNNAQAYPPINLSTTDVAVLLNSAPYQSANIFQVSAVTQSGSNITFQVSRSDAGNPSGDGYFYADILIVAQAK